MEAANNKRIKSVFLPHFVTMNSSASTHELHIPIIHVLDNLRSKVRDFREVTDNSVNDEMTE